MTPVSIRLHTAGATVYHDHPAWEYTAIPLNTALVDTLNALGADGWELVAVVDGHAILKRPMRSLREIVTEEQRTRAFSEYATGKEQSS